MRFGQVGEHVMMGIIESFNGHRKQLGPGAMLPG